MTTTAPRPHITFRGGLLPHDPDRPHLLLSAILDAQAAPPPDAFDGLSQVPHAAWGMLGNDQVGDCTCAGVAHERICVHYASTGEVLSVTTAQTLKFYEHFGYNPKDPNSDQGAMCQKVLETWHKIGFLGEKVMAFAKVNFKNRVEVKQAISSLGPLYIGFSVTQSAEDQFNAGEPWTLVPGSEDLGGHCVIVGSYDDEGLDCVTWGTVQRMTWEFFEAQTSEAWTLFGKDNLSAKVSLDQLKQLFTAVTGRRLATAPKLEAKVAPAQQVTVGRAVHYVSHGTPVHPDGSQAFTSQCRAADVTEVGQDGTVGLMVKNPTGLFFHSLAHGGSDYDEAALPAGGTWHWPERV